MKYIYKLSIDAPRDQYNALEAILGVKTNFLPSHGWGIELVEEEEEEDESIFFIDYFLSILAGKYEQLEKIGVIREHIVVWMLYEYDYQCNMSFPAKDMYNLGKEGITLCVSCWEKQVVCWSEC